MEKSRQEPTRRGFGTLMKLLADIRQWSYPKEFRIDSAAWPASLPDLLRQLGKAEDDRSAPGTSVDREALPGRLLADVGTGLWRLRQKMVEPGTDRPLEEMRRAFRHLESITDALAQAGVEIRSHTGEVVPEQGIYALRVIAFQPTPGLARDRVLETIKPSVYYQGELIQMGEVIVGTPASPAGEREQDDHRHETGASSDWRAPAGAAGYGTEDGGDAHG